MQWQSLQILISWYENTIIYRSLGSTEVKYALFKSKFPIMSAKKKGQWTPKANSVA